VVALRFPVYILASQDGVVVVSNEGKDCIMLFHEHSLAELQGRQIQSVHQHLGKLRPLAVPSAAALREGLHSLPPDVTCAVWDQTAAAGTFTHVGIDEILRAAESP
jgi:hypothetical protein